MTYTTTVKVYKSGNSKVITIPAKLDVEEGDEFKLKAKNKNIELKKIKKKKKSVNEKIEKYAGMWKGKTGEEIAKHAKEFRKNFKFIPDK